MPPSIISRAAACARRSRNAAWAGPEFLLPMESSKDLAARGDDRLIARARRTIDHGRALGLGIRHMADAEDLENRAFAAAVRTQAVLGVDAHGRDARRRVRPAPRDAVERLVHEIHPDRYRRRAAHLVRAERPVRVEADPCDGDDARMVAREPRVAVVVRRARL